MIIDDEGYKQVMQAIEGNDVDKLKQLLDTGVAPHPTPIYASYFLSPIAKAVVSNKYECFLELIKRDRFDCFGDDANTVYQGVLHIAFVLAAGLIKEGKRADFLTALYNTGELKVDFSIAPIIGQEMSLGAFITSFGSDEAKEMLTTQHDTSMSDSDSDDESENDSSSSSSFTP